MAKKHVIILGGGVAGMSAAHELIERGFKVTVFEKRECIPGGKARSIPVEGSAANGGKPLPGEHGFRFFPGFYRHMFHTLKRIPFKDEKKGKENKNGVFDNLVECPEIMLARMGKDSIQTPSHFPRSIEEIKKIISNLKNVKTGLEAGEGEVILTKIWQLFTSCRERRENEYETIGWRQFTEADKYSKSYDTLFVGGLTGSLVAGKASLANTRTNGAILIQILLDILRPFRISDRILNSPTNEAWLFPWLSYLKEKGVDYRFGCTAVDLDCDDRKIRGVWIKEKKQKKYCADYYLCALPVERAAELISAEAVLKLDPKLQNILKLKHTVAWMNGIQFFLHEDVPISKGHIILPDTPWALTAISQAQFWKEFSFSESGKRNVKGVLSVIISNWTKPGLLHNKPAEDCTRKEVIEEVWEQMCRCFNRAGQVLEESNVERVYVANSISFPEAPFSKGFLENKMLNEPARYGRKFLEAINENDEPLLVNEINTWGIRNETFTAIPNFFLASDYVRTNTNLATMEGANEAARRAVNNIIDASGVKADYCRVWNLKEPSWLSWYKWLDQRRYKMGLPWKMHKPWFTGLLKVILR